MATRHTLDQAATAGQLAQLGYHVHPLLRGKKAPRSDHGHQDATTDLATIQQWYALFPDDNIGISLEASGLLVIAPDSPSWLVEFQRRGLPDTMIVQTGSGEGHRHYYYRRPANCPIHRICKSNEFDVLTGGYVVAPGSITTGPYTLLTAAQRVEDLPEAPDWAIAMLRHTAERAAQTITPSQSSEGPPVRLGTYAMQWWAGERRAGDRSGTLLAIAKECYRAGATVTATAMAIADRDMALGLNKYAGRSDAAIRYRMTAERAAAEVDAEPRAHIAAATTVVPPAQTDDRFVQLEQRIAALEEENRTLRELQSQTAQVLQNRNLTAGEKLTLLAVVNYVGSKVSRDKVEDDGWVGVPLEAIAENACSSPATASRHITRAESAGILQKRVTSERVEIDDPNTGQKHTSWRKRLQVKTMHPTTRETLQALATAAPERSNHGWGGKRTKRPVCPDCGPAESLVIKRQAVCVGCGSIVADLPDQHIAGDTENPIQTGNCILQDTRTAAPSTPAPVDLTKYEHLAISDADAKTAAGADMCRDCRRPLPTLAERAAGVHAYDCLALVDMTPMQPRLTTAGAPYRAGNG